MRGTKETRKRMGGMAIVEAALVLPVLMTLALGMIESGNMLSAWLTVQKAAQTGARYAATGQGDEEGTRLALIETTTRAALGSLSSGSVVSVSSWAGIAAEGQGAEGNPGPPCGVVEVRVVCAYQTITPLGGTVFPEELSISGRQRKLIEPFSPCE